MNELALFAGAGGGILGGKLLGWRTVCAVEWEPYPASVLCARQNDGILPTFPIWDDVQTFDGRPWKGIVDVISGGFPCQDISVAGKGAGITGQRSGMWSYMARIIGEVRPRFVFVENSSALIVRGLGIVLNDLAEIGYDCRWTVLGASDIGAPHQRDRFWLMAWDTNCKHDREIGQIQTASIDAGRVCQTMANTDSMRQLQPQGSKCDQWGRVGNCGEKLADANGKRFKKLNAAGITKRTGRFSRIIDEIGRNEWWTIEPDVGRVVNGVAARVDRLKAIGNGQVPLCAATAWRLLNG